MKHRSDFSTTDEKEVGNKINSMEMIRSLAFPSYIVRLGNRAPERINVIVCFSNHQDVLVSGGADLDLKPLKKIQ